MRSSLAALLLLAGCADRPSPAEPAEPPNVLYILADDLGYGDLSCLNPESKLATRNLDRLAAEGMIFTDAHSGSAVCSPTRYGILTGRYAWRTRLQEGVLEGFSPPLIVPRRRTVASMLRGRGYDTACIGKWHLGWTWGGTPNQVDYTVPIRNGPTAAGFDAFYGISASLDMPPYLWVENDRSVGVPTTTKAFHRPGPAHADFEAVDVLPTITRKAVEYLDGRRRDSRPFFLYVPLNAPHTPIVPSPEFAGKSGLGKYGDFVLQVDAAVGEILKALDRTGQAGRTLVIFTSDNGCSPSADFAALRRHGHNPNFVFRGAKADIFEGGHHIPFLARWPGTIRPGSRFDETICLTDLMATCAQMVGETLPDDAAEDSVSLMPAFRGTAKGPLREATVHHSVNGSFSIRQGPWKLELCPDSGGWSPPRPGKDDTSTLPRVQLYDLSMDPGERRNLQGDRPAEVERLTRLLRDYVENGRSTPGRPQRNDVAIVLEKGKK
jgi:arylsulfatase A-like enzyme